VISGLALGVLVVEGNLRSGALITARAAKEQDREVFALPGKVDSPLSRGPHSLIKDGAKLVEGHQDILDELGPSADVLRLSDEEGQVSEERAAPSPSEATADAEEPAAQSGRAERAAETGKVKKKREPAKAFPGLSHSERKLYECLSSDPRSIDDITEETEMSPAEVSAGLLVLEIRRLARQLPGKMFVGLR
jgi:DNA processing protein